MNYIVDTPLFSRAWRAFALALVISTLALAFACGGDDDGDDDVTPTDDATATATGGPTPSRTQGGTPVSTPAGTTGLPVECSVGDEQLGLISRVEFAGEDGIFEAGEPIEITQTMINCGDNTVALNYATTQRFILTVEDAETAVIVWDSSTDKAFDEVPDEVEIEVGGTQVLTETWDQTNTDGEQVPAGEYKVSFLNVGCAVEAQSDCRFGSVKSLIIE